MRVTNKMMTNNMLYNINSNKNTLSKLEDQYDTGSKIQKPSDDPIVAVRALTLRSNISQLNQYYEKNIPDALAWMDVTESALKTTNSILTQMHTYLVQGTTDSLTADNRDAIIENLSQLVQQVYQEGNTDYAGRYVFTGYKTDTSLVFSDDTTDSKYDITQNFSADDVTTVQRAVNSVDLSSYDSSNPTAADLTNKPNQISVKRIRLAYDNLMTSSDGGTINIQIPETDASGNTTYTAYSGTVNEKLSSDSDAYEPADGTITYLSDTGELVLSDSANSEISTAGGCQITYSKNSFAKNDLRPEHYFNCTVTDLTGTTDPVTYTKADQDIKYEINFSQSIQINTQGSDAIQHAVGRCVDDLQNAVDDVQECEDKISNIKEQLEDTSLTDDQKSTLNSMLDLANTEYSIKEEVMQDAFSSSLTEITEQQDVVNVATTDLGARYKRVELTQNRLSDEQVDFTGLLSDNEDADLADTIIKYQSQQVVYNASLSAAAKAVKTTLMDFL